MGTTTATLGLVESERTSSLIWFSSQGCVDRSGARVSVWIGGSLVSEYDRQDSGARNVLAVGLALDSKVHLGRLAEAFGVTSETLRVLRRLRETEGVEALVQRHHGGAYRVKVTPQRRAKIEAMFERGHSINEVFGRVGSRWELGRSTIGTVHTSWSARRAPTTPAVAAEAEAASQEELALMPAGTPPPVTEAPPASSVAPVERPSSGSTDEHVGADETIDTRDPESGRTVQHAGA